MQTAGAEAAVTAEWASQRDYLLSQVVQNVEDEGAKSSTAVPVAAVVVLRNIEDLLSECVLHHILVVGLPS